MKTVNLLYAIILAFALVSCNESGEIEKTYQTSLWPRNPSKGAIDSTLVIKAISLDDIDTYQTVARSDFSSYTPSFNDAELGKSLNSATKDIGANIIKYNFTKEELNSKNIGTIEYDFKLVKDIYDLVRKFDLDVSASVKYFGFKANAKYEMAQRLNINKYHEFIAARILVKDREESLKHLFITKDASELAMKDTEKFIDKYGDQVITSKIIGGDLIALIEIESTNATQAQSNKIHIDAALKFFGGGASTSANMSQALNELNQTSKYTIKLISNGISPDSSDKFTDINYLKKLINSFPSRISKAGQVLEYKTSSIFHSIEDLPSEVNEKNFLKINRQYFELGLLEDKVNSIIPTLQDLGYILQNPHLFNKADVDHAKLLYNRHYQILRIYQHNIRVCRDVPELCSQCNVFKYHIPEFSPNLAVNTENAPTAPITSDLPITGDYITVADIPKKTLASVDFAGKLQYVNAKIIPCRVPVFSMTDFMFDFTVNYTSYQVFDQIMPLIQLQFFEKKDEEEHPYNPPFYYGGVPIDVPYNVRHLILKARIDLVWTNVDGNNTLIIKKSDLENENSSIKQYVKPCGGTNSIKVSVIQ